MPKLSYVKGFRPWGWIILLLSVKDMTAHRTTEETLSRLLSEMQTTQLLPTRPGERLAPGDHRALARAAVRDSPANSGRSRSGT